MPTLCETVTVKLREMIVKGEIAPGARVQERDLAASFKVSRTPVRLALGILEAEGLVLGVANRGFVVSDFGLQDILGALDVRGALEAFAVRTLIEQGVDQNVTDELREAAKEGDRLVAKGNCEADDMRRWALANDRFHTTIVEACGNSALSKTHKFLSRMPMVAPIAILFTNNACDDAQGRMEEALRDHLEILDAIERGQAARAESLMREHVYRSRANLERLISLERENSPRELLSGMESNLARFGQS